MKIFKAVTKAVHLTFSLVLISGLLPVTAHALTGGYPASDVIGQTGFTAKTTDNLDTPAATAIDTTHHRLFVADTDNARILIYDLDAANNLIDHNPVHVLGCMDIACNTRNETPSAFDFPTGLVYDSQHNWLFVSDYSMNRVLVFDMSNVSDGMDPVHYLGQSNGSDHSHGTSANQLYAPGGMAYDGSTNYLYVSDYSNNRVVVYDLSNGISADGMDAFTEIGQTDFGLRVATASQASLYGPWGIAVDQVGHRLFVADFNNKRLLVYDLNSLSKGMSASHVWGQTGYSGHSCIADETKSMCYPLAVTFDPVSNRLYVATYGDNKVAIYDTSTITDNQSDIAVLGQPDLNSYYNNDTSKWNLDFSDDNEASMAFDPVNNRLYVPDGANNRIMIFDFAHFTTPTGTITAATAGSPYSFNFATSGSQCTQVVTKSSGTLPPGLTLSSAGLLSGTPTHTGNFSFEINISDDCGAVGAFGQDPAYTISVTAGAPNTGFGVNSTNPLPYFILLSGGFGLMVSLRQSHRRPQK